MHTNTKPKLGNNVLLRQVMRIEPGRKSLTPFYEGNFVELNVYSIKIWKLIRKMILTVLSTKMSTHVNEMIINRRNVLYQRYID